ncbi:MAG TPA: FMN-binding glutamate synthase family protein, partial [Ramlibacter sp.]
QRVYNFHHATLHALKDLVQASGLEHPGDIGPHHIVRRISDVEVKLLSNLITRVEPGALLGSDLAKQHNVFSYYWPMARADRFSPALVH